MTKQEISNYVLHTPENTNLSILNGLLSQYEDSISYFYKESNLTKVEDYLYSIDYNSVNYEAGEEYLRKYKVNLGGCSSVVAGKIYGRNYDWYYDNSISFIISVSGAQHKSIGMTTLAALDKSFVEQAKWDDLYEVLPNMTLDGINDAGVVCNTNVVPTGDKGRTTGIGGDGDLCGLCIVRYILDNADSAKDAIEKLKTKNIWMSNNGGYDLEIHVMISDGTDSFVVEFVNNKMVVIEDQNIMTNFYIDGVEFNSNGSVYTPATQDETYNAIITNHITPYGEGLERYNILNSYLESVVDISDMKDLMASIFFSNAYAENPDEDSWYTELVGSNGITCATDWQECIPTMEKFYSMYVERTREDKKTWQTVHSTVYDIENLTMSVCVQEGTIWYDYNLE